MGVYGLTTIGLLECKMNKKSQQNAPKHLTREQSKELKYHRYWSKISCGEGHKGWRAVNNNMCYECVQDRKKARDAEKSQPTAIVLTEQEQMLKQMLNQKPKRRIRRRIKPQSDSEIRSYEWDEILLFGPAFGSREV